MTDVRTLLRDQLHTQAEQLPPMAIDLGQLRRRSRRLRAGRLACGAVAVLGCGGVGVLAVAGHGDRAPAPNASGPPISAEVRLTHDVLNDVTCSQLYFPATAQSLQVSCARLPANRSDLAAGLTSVGGSGQAQATPDRPASTFVVGELLPPGRVTVTDDVGQAIPASILPGPVGYPYEIFVADLGPHAGRTITVALPGGKETTYDVPTSAPQQSAQPG